MRQEKRELLLQIINNVNLLYGIKEKVFGTGMSNYFFVSIYQVPRVHFP